MDTEHVVRPVWTLFSQYGTGFVHARLAAALKAVLYVRKCVCLGYCLDGQQWCIIKSSVEPPWTSSSGCYCGLVCLSACLSHSSSGWTYICIVIAHAVRLV